MDNDNYIEICRTDDMDMLVLIMTGLIKVNIESYAEKTNGTFVLYANEKCY